MNVIYKYVLKNDRTVLDLPKGAKVLTAQMQDEDVCLWVMVDPKRENETRIFNMYGTGHTIINPEQLVYVATVQMHDGEVVLHVFESVQLQSPEANHG